MAWAQCLQNKIHFITVWEAFFFFYSLKARLRDIQITNFMRFLFFVLFCLKSNGLIFVSKRITNNLNLNLLAMTLVHPFLKPCYGHITPILSIYFKKFSLESMSPLNRQYIGFFNSPYLPNYPYQASLIII